VSLEYVIFLNDAATEALSFAPLDEEGAGWARYFSPEFSPELNGSGLNVLVRIGFPHSRERWEDPDAPLVIREAQLASGALPAALVRKLPIERIGLAVNHPAHHLHLARYVSQHHFVPVPNNGPWREELPVVPRPENPELVLGLSAGPQRKPDDFYARVADAYAWLASRGASPARDLAEKNGVPVTTVHRWVKEARARGLLPPAIGRGSGKRGERT